MLELKLTNWNGELKPKKPIDNTPKREVVEKFVPTPIPQIKLPTAPKIKTPTMPKVGVSVIKIEEDMRDNTILIAVLCSCVLVSILVATIVFCHIRKSCCFANKP